MFILLILLYPFAIQYQRGGYYRILMPLTLVTAIIDTYVNYIEFSLLIWQLPRGEEHTVSQRCNRLINEDGWAGNVARVIQTYCNFFYANHIH